MQVGIYFLFWFTIFSINFSGVVSEDLKLFLDLKSSNLTWEGDCFKCRTISGNFSGIAVKLNETATLIDYRDTCISDPDTCSNGLAFEIWLEFVDYDSRSSTAAARNVILQSGSVPSRGFELSVRDTVITFSVYTAKNTSESRVKIPHFNHLVHVVGSWNSRTMVAQLFVDNVSEACVNIRTRDTRQTDDSLSIPIDRDLKLTPIAKLGEGFVVAQNLSIWMRSFNDTERQKLFEYQSPKISGAWSNWTKCVWPCNQMRYRNCPECNVQIKETRPCYHVHECGLKMNWPLQNPSNLTWEGECLECRDLVASSALVLPNKLTASLGNFARKCVSRLDRCVTGLTFEAWLWFAETWKGISGTILQSGNKSGFELSTTARRFILKLYTGMFMYECHAEVNDNWNHVVGSWNKELNIVNLTINGPPSVYCNMKFPYEMRERFGDGRLLLGPLTTADQGFVVTQNLSIWMRALTPTEMDHLFRQPIPDVPPSWTEWSSCVKPYCTQSRERKCQRASCTVDTRERRTYLECPGYVEMKVVIRFVDEEWSEELVSNATHSLLARRIEHNIQEIYRDDGNCISTAVNSFSQGSVIADINITYFDISCTQVITLLKHLDHGYLNGNMAVAYNYSDFRILNSLVPGGWPQIVELFNTSSTSFNVSWLYMKNTSYVKGFRIYFKSLESAQWKTSSVSKHVSHTQITGLKPFTMHEVLVLAYSMEGDGLPSPIRNVTTDEWVPEVGPPNLKAYWNKTDFTVHVTWSQIPKSLIHGYLTHYVITYSNSTHNVTKTSRMNSSVLTGLPIFIRCTIDVVGATRIGIGLKSSKIIFRTRGLPLPAPKNLTVTNITGPAINVSWTSIPHHPNFDKVVGYKVYYYYHSYMEILRVPVNQTHVVIEALCNVNYDITVTGLTVDNKEGRPATTSTFLKNVTAPTLAPSNLSCPGVFPYTIVVGWYGFTPLDTGGSLKGYILSYNVKGDPRNMINVTLDPYQPWFTLESLTTLTEYEIRVLVYNEKGFSPLATITCKTGIGAPEVTPQNLEAHSYVGDTFIPLFWQHVFMNGTRRGYRIHYRKVSEAGTRITDSTLKAMEFSENATKAIVPGLDVYSKYCFQLFVLNENFPSKPSNSVCAETCRCPHRFYTNWFIQDPYVVTSSSGIFPPLVKSMIAGVCRRCKAYNNSVLVDFKMDGNGGTAQKNTSKIVQLVKAIDATQVSFPVVGPETGLMGHTGAFIAIINSPMSAFITLRPVVHIKAQYVIEETLVNTLPLIVLTFVLLLLGAILIWIAEYKSKENTFPKPFHKGVPQGFWWAFVSVTTVGYGDKIPSSKAGQLLSIIWILYGTVFIGLITASLTTALNVTFVVVSTDVTLYNSHVAALDYSLEVQLGLLKGAHVNEGRNYSDLNSILRAVENGDVDGALIDKLAAARLNNLSDPSSGLIVKNVIPKPSTYGIFLAGDAIKLQKKFRQYLQNNADFVTEQIKNYTEPLKKVSQEDEKDMERKEKTSQANLLSGSSPIFFPLFWWLLAVLIFVAVVGVVWHFIYYKHVAQAAKKNQVCVLNEGQTRALSLKQFVRDFNGETYKKLRDLKSRHIKELKALYKLKTR